MVLTRQRSKESVSKKPNPPPKLPEEGVRKSKRVKVLTPKAKAAKETVPQNAKKKTDSKTNTKQDKASVNEKENTPIEDIKTKRLRNRQNPVDYAESPLTTTLNNNKTKQEGHKVPIYLRDLEDPKEKVQKDLYKFTDNDKKPVRKKGRQKRGAKLNVSTSSDEYDKTIRDILWNAAKKIRKRKPNRVFPVAKQPVPEKGSVQTVPEKGSVQPVPEIFSVQSVPEMCGVQPVPDHGNVQHVPDKCSVLPVPEAPPKRVNVVPRTIFVGTSTPTQPQANTWRKHPFFDLSRIDKAPPESPLSFGHRSPVLGDSQSDKSTSKPESRQSVPSCGSLSDSLGHNSTVTSNHGSLAIGAESRQSLTSCGHSDSLGHDNTVTSNHAKRPESRNSEPSCSHSLKGVPEADWEVASNHSDGVEQPNADTNDVSHCFGFDQSDSEEPPSKIRVLGNDLLSPRQPTRPVKVYGDEQRNPLNPWRFDSVNIMRNPHFLSYKNTALPRINQDMVLDHFLVDKFDRSPFRTPHGHKTPFRLDEEGEEEENARTPGKRAVQKYMNDFVHGAKKIADKDHGGNKENDPKLTTSLYGIEEFSPIKEQGRARGMVTRAKRKVLGDRTEDNLVESAPSPVRETAKVVLREMEDEQDLQDKDNGDTSTNLTQTVIEGELHLFEDPADTIRNRSMHQYKATKRAKKWAQPEEEKEHKPRKKDKMTKQEEQEAEEWAAAFNSMCEEVEKFPLEIERQKRNKP